ncbi:MAG TPA: tetratricopeptide repeat protein [Verrucomicrobiota bacterium]|jgi:tetratricopeptide (TPR) repeat protein|nr:tetratricopeptide repeat protein [Verrucomicrobiota bacterium]HQL79070.1 tetratricopeptide repeat protein [Verrucomicrobiota bacterium]
MAITVRRDWITLSVLGVLTLALFYPVVNFEFLNFDDPDYVTKNPIVQTGLTVKGVLWAFQTTHASNYHPLTWLFHMLDCELYGLTSGGHHLTNVFLHLANTLVLFALLRRMTGALWPSALVAALFAWHPLHVESVAWVSERKDVLSTLFGLLALLAYGFYAERPGWKRYALTLLAFVLSLLAKPMLVTLPFLLLLLDFWPLGRSAECGVRGAESGGSGRLRLWRKLILEKAPFFGLSLISCVVTFLAQKGGGSVASMAHIPLGERAANAAVAYASYLWQTIWPLELAAFYPHPLHSPGVKVMAALLVLLAVSAVVFLSRRAYLIMGWLWYLGTLVPVIGLVQVGDHARADRYTYLPLVGIFIGVVWAATELAAARPSWRRPLQVLAVCVGALLMLSTRLQLSHWKSSENLFQRALAVTDNNYIAHNNLGNVLDLSGQHAAAKQHYQETLRIRPDFAGTHYNLANVFAREGNLDAALKHYRAAIELQPNYADAHYNLGVLLANRGQADQAIEHYQAAFRSRPAFAEAHNSLGNLLFQQGKLTEAIAAYRAALQARPDYLDALLNLALALQQAGKDTEAVQQYAEATRLHPESPRAHSDLGVALARQGQFREAERHLAEVVRLEPQNADAHYNLGNVLLDQGKAEQAAAQYAETLRLNPKDAKARQKLERATSALAPSGRHPLETR